MLADWGGAGGPECSSRWKVNPGDSQIFVEPYLRAWAFRIVRRSGSIQRWVSAPDPAAHPASRTAFQIPNRLRVRQTLWGGRRDPIRLHDASRRTAIVH